MEGMHWQHKMMKHKMAATSGKQEDTKWDPRAEPRAGDCKASSQVAANKWQDILEEWASLPDKKDNWAYIPAV
jgi:hypothetical protein